MTSAPGQHRTVGRPGAPSRFGHHAFGEVPASAKSAAWDASSTRRPSWRIAPGGAAGSGRPRRPGRSDAVLAGEYPASRTGTRGVAQLNGLSTQAAQSVQIITPFFSLASRLRWCTRKQLEQVNSSACLGTTRTDSSSPDRSAPGSSKFSADRSRRHRRRRIAPRCGAPSVLLERVLGHLVGLRTPWGVVVGSHRSPGSPPQPCDRALYQRRTHPPNDSCPKITGLFMCDLHHTIGVRRRACSSAAWVPLECRRGRSNHRRHRLRQARSAVPAAQLPAGDHRRGRLFAILLSSGDRPDQAGGRASGRGVQRAAGPDRPAAPSSATRCRCRRWSTSRRPSSPTPRSRCSTPAARAVRPARSPARCATSASRSRPPRTPALRQHPADLPGPDRFGRRRQTRPPRRSGWWRPASSSSGRPPGRFRWTWPSGPSSPRSRTATTSTRCWPAAPGRHREPADSALLARSTTAPAERPQRSFRSDLTHTKCEVSLCVRSGHAEPFSPAAQSPRPVQRVEQLRGDTRRGGHQ